jgi:hypothetical protein
MTDPTPPSKGALDYLSQWSPVLLLLLGGLLNQLWTRFRTRLRRFAWKAWHNRIAVAANDAHMGQVTVQHDGVPVNNVHLSTVEVENDSSEDFQNISVTLAFKEGSRILNSSALIQGDLHAIPLDDAFLKQFDGVAPEQLAGLVTYVVFAIPVFNRHQKANFNLLVTRDDANAPFVTVSCNHVGIRLEPKVIGLELDGVPFKLAAWVGIVATFVVVLLIIRFQRHPHPFGTPIYAWLLGVYCAKLGAGLVKAWRSFQRALG